MAVATHTQEIIRAHLAWSQADPFLDNHSLRVIEDGAVIVCSEKGTIQFVGSSQVLEYRPQFKLLCLIKY